MKKFLTVILIVLILSGCSSKQKTNGTPNESLAQEKIDKSNLQKTKQSNVTSNESVVKIQTLDKSDLQLKNCITVDEALNLCSDIIGSKDDEDFMFLLAEEHTGREIGYSCSGVITYNNKKYYMMCMRWTSEKECHWSTIGNIAVSVVGNEIYDIRAYENDFYSLAELLWHK